MVLRLARNLPKQHGVSAEEAEADTLLSKCFSSPAQLSEQSKGKGFFKKFISYKLPVELEI